MKRIVFGFMLILLCSFVSAGLGTYERSDDVFFSVTCRTNDGSTDTGCTLPGTSILPGNDTVGKAVTTAMAEVSDTNFPGLWRGKYTIPAGAYIGTWSIYVNLTNSNLTSSSTVLWFQIANYGFNAINSRFDTLYSDNGLNFTRVDNRFNSLSSDIGLNTSYLNNSINSRSNSLDAGIIAVNSTMISKFNDVNNNATINNNSISGLVRIVETFIKSVFYTDVDSNFTRLNNRVTSLSSDIGLNTSYLNSTINLRANTIDSDLALNFTYIRGRFNSQSSDIGLNTSYLNSSINSRSNSLDTRMISLSSDINSNFSNFTIRFNTIDNWLSNIWSTVTNTSLGLKVWSSAERNLTSFNWNTAFNWNRFTTWLYPNSTITYRYDSNYQMQNVTYNFTDFNISRNELFNYNDSYLANVSVRSIR